VVSLVAGRQRLAERGQHGILLAGQLSEEGVHCVVLVV
jgi:hypothetical protein